MKNSARCCLRSAGAAPAPARLFMGAYPNSVLVFDEAQGQGRRSHPARPPACPPAMRLSPDQEEDLRHHQRSQRHRSHRCRHAQSDQSLRAEHGRPNATASTAARPIPTASSSTPSPRRSTSWPIATRSAKPKYTVIDLAAAEDRQDRGHCQGRRERQRRRLRPRRRSKSRPTANTSISSATTS